MALAYCFVLTVVSFKHRLGSIKVRSTTPLASAVRRKVGNPQGACWACTWSRACYVTAIRTSSQHCRDTRPLQMSLRCPPPNMEQVPRGWIPSVFNRRTLGFFSTRGNTPLTGPRLCRTKDAGVQNGLGAGIELSIWHDSLYPGNIFLRSFQVRLHSIPMRTVHVFMEA